MNKLLNNIINKRYKYDIFNAETDEYITFNKNDNFILLVTPDYLSGVELIFIDILKYVKYRK